MDSLFFAVGLTTFGLGAAMIVFASTVMRRNRRRETARAALLSGLAFPGGLPVDDAIDDAMPDAGGRIFSPDRFRHEPAPALDTGTLFSEPETSGAASRRTMALAAVGVVMAAVAGTYWWYASSSASATSEPASLASATTVAVTPPPATAPPRVELLALDHAATRSAFVVTGRIRNPVDASPLHDVVAVVHLVDGDGRVLMTVRAPLKPAVLNGGDVSEFSATATKATNVGRYRVEFHAKERQSLPQIDRRGQERGNT